MREIKFRGKKVCDGKWVYGHYVKYNVSGECFMHDGFSYESLSKINPKSIGQFIGLKDKNGLDIFEDDKVNTNYGKWYHNKDGLTRNGVVIFDKKTASFKISVENSAVLVGFYDINKIEVIGNIHEVAE